MAWAVEYHKLVEKDLHKPDNAQRKQVFKAIKKVAQNPLPDYEGGYGKPLGNRAAAQLAGYCKIKLRKSGLRVVYGIVREQEIMTIVVISIRSDETVYKLAEQRVKPLSHPARPMQN
jgi:mRNA interferase RelE/StbE